jgi:DNA-binding transcriptional ArsR family regulator
MSDNILAMASVEVLLHPVRLRVVQRLLGQRQLTTADLAAELPDVAPATLYRHVAILVEAGVLTVVAQRRIRGAVERRYELSPEHASAGREDLATMSHEQLRTSFGIFTASLLAEFDNYLAGPDVDMAHDAVGFRTAALHLREDDVAELTERLRAAVQPWTSPRAGARRHLFSTVLIPAYEPEDPTATT